MKKLLIALIALAMLAGCGTTNMTFTRLPDELSRFTFVKDKDGITMVERSTGIPKQLTKNEVKRLNKLQPAAARVAADRFFDN